MEADHPSLALPDGGGAEVSTGSQAGLDELRLRRWITLQVELDELLALRDNYPRRVTEDLHEILLAVALL